MLSVRLPQIAKIAFSEEKRPIDFPSFFSKTKDSKKNTRKKSKRTSDNVTKPNLRLTLQNPKKEIILHISFFLT